LKELFSKVIKRDCATQIIVRISFICNEYY